MSVVFTAFEQGGVFIVPPCCAGHRASVIVISDRLIESTILGSGERDCLCKSACVYYIAIFRHFLLKLSVGSFCLRVLCVDFELNWF